MTQNVFSIDGRYYNVLIPENGIQRKFEILDTDKAGRLINGDMSRDIIGTFYNYTVSLDTKHLNLSEYDELYDVISSPSDYHTIILPYGQNMLEFKAYITNGSDTLKNIVGQERRWKGLSINFIAMSPKRRPL